MKNFTDWSVDRKIQVFLFIFKVAKFLNSIYIRN